MEQEFGAGVTCAPIGAVTHSRLRLKKYRKTLKNRE